MPTTRLNGQAATVAVPPTSATPAHDPAWFINHELSWLDFNERVLEEARDPANPLNGDGPVFEDLSIHRQ